MNSLDDMEPVWMMRARREIGTKEKFGEADNPRIVEYLATTRITPKMHHDSVPWCAAFVCWVMEGTDIASTRSAAARSWLKWGKQCEAKIGAVVVLSRHSDDNPNSAHVGFYAGDDGENILVLGGNQSNKVCVKAYPKDRVLGYRWPDV